MKRVIILSTQRAGDRTGVKTYCDSLEILLNAKAVSVLRLSHHDCSDLVRKIWQILIRISTLFGVGVKLAITRLAIYYMARSALSRNFTKSISAIYAQDPITSAAASKYKEDKKTKIVCTCHFSDPIEEVFVTEKTGKLGRFFVAALMRYFISKTSLYFVMTKTVAEKMRRFAPEADIKIVPTICKGIPDQGRMAHDKFRIIMAGRLEYMKGQERLVKMMPEIKDAELWLLGDGPDKVRLSTLANEYGVSSRVRMLGFCEKPERIYGQCDLYVHCSRMECMPLAPLEAICSGIPAMCYPFPGWNDWGIYDEIPLPTVEGILEIMSSSKDKISAIYRKQRAKVERFNGQEAVCAYLS